MKRKLSVILAAVLMLALSFTFVACGEQSSKYTITFNSMGGSDVAAITAAAGEQVTAPAAPAKDGYEFLGWFESSDGGATLSETEFTVGYMPSKNVTVYAKWESVSEVGKTYAVKDYKTDVIFTSDDSTVIPASDEDKQTYSVMRIKFKDNRGIELSVGSGMKDDTRFYAVNDENCVEFFETAEDAQNMTNKLTEDYYGLEYRFSSDKKTLSVTMRPDEGKVTINIVLSVEK